MQITTLGCDPEVLLVNNAGRFMSSVGLIGGSKIDPMPIDEYGNAVQEDNVTVEFNIPPCKSAADFIKHININKEWIATTAKHLGLEMKIIPSAVYDDEQLDSYAAQTFGCEPDFNAWDEGRQNPRPRTENANLRSAGGHIHVAFKDLDMLSVIKAMDLFVGCPMLRHDTDSERRKLYGKAGAFRPKKYGAEYRTCSNVWIQTDELIQWVWDQTDRALEFVSSDGIINEATGHLIQQCINEGNYDALAQLEAEFNL